MLSLFVEDVHVLHARLVEHRELDLADADALEFNTGLTSAEGIRRVVVSESAVGSIAYSML